MNDEVEARVPIAPEISPELLQLVQSAGLQLRADDQGLQLLGEGPSGEALALRGDFSRMVSRVKQGKIQHELLAKAAKIKGVSAAPGQLLAVDCTAGLGEDSLLLAASGFRVIMFEKNPVIAALLADALARASQLPELADIVSRMHLVQGDSVEGLRAMAAGTFDAAAAGDLAASSTAAGGLVPDVVFLDPMFPARQKSALVKKKLQMIQLLESPCDDENTLVQAALAVGARKVIIKRPPKGPYLAGIKPGYSLEGKAVRYDILVGAPRTDAPRAGEQLAGADALSGTPRIETQRLVLRPWEDADASSLFKYAKDPDVGPIAGWPVHTSEQNSLEIIRGVLSAPETYAVVLKDTNEPIGSIGLITPQQSHTAIADHELEVGFWVGKPHWGNGYIPEACRAIVAYAFETLGCSALWCGYYDGNQKSARAQAKCGFVFHHTEHDKPCSVMGDVRTEHFTRLTRESWESEFSKKRADGSQEAQD